jgi:putative membrane protein
MELSAMQTLVLLGLAAFLSACSHMGDALKDPSAAAGATTRDARFMSDIVQVNLAGIEAGRLAAAKAHSPEVRRFAQEMVEEHAALERQGARIASRKGMPVPREPNARQQAAMEKLESLSGGSFDRAYLEHRIEEQGRALELLAETVSEGKDRDLRAHAQEAIPQMRRNLDTARRLAGDVPGLR